MGKFHHDYYKVLCEWVCIEGVCIEGGPFTIEVLLIWKDTPAGGSGVCVSDVYHDSVTIHMYQDSIIDDPDLIGMAIRSRTTFIEELERVSYLSLLKEELTSRVKKVMAIKV